MAASEALEVAPNERVAAGISVGTEILVFPRKPPNGRVG